MRRIVGAFLVLVLTVSVGSELCFGQYLVAPKSETILPGTARIEFAGQAVVFTTPVKIFVWFENMGSGRIRIRVKTALASRAGMALAPSEPLRIYWEDGDEVLFEGTPPGGGWSGILLTEGGLTEK